MARPLASITRTVFGAEIPEGPARTFVATALLGSTGNGMFAASAVLFFTGAVDISAKDASIALTVAGIVAIVGNALGGRYLDRLPAVRAMVVLCAARALLYGSLAGVTSFGALVLVLAVALTLDLVNQPIKQALMSAMLTPEARRETFAVQRTATNVAFAVGAAVAGVVVSLQDDGGLRLLILGNALLFIPMAVLYVRIRPGSGLPPTGLQPPTAKAPRRASPWRDSRYVVFSVGSGMLMLGDAVMFFALPLWIARETDAPIAVLSVVLILNTATTAVTQARWARKLVGPRLSALALLAAGALLALGCVAFLAAGSTGPEGATTLLVVGGLLLSVAESMYTSAAWEASVLMAPEGQHGHYFSVTSGFGALSEMIGPLLIASVLLPSPLAGWLLFAAVFAVSGLAAAIALRANADIRPALA